MLRSLSLPHGPDDVLAHVQSLQKATGSEDAFVEVLDSDDSGDKCCEILKADPRWQPLHVDTLGRRIREIRARARKNFTTTATSSSTAPCDFATLEPSSERRELLRMAAVEVAINRHLETEGLGCVRVTQVREPLYCEPSLNLSLARCTHRWSPVIDLLVLVP